MAASKFIPEHRDALIEHTAAGRSLRCACRALGFREATVKGWLTRGRREAAGPYTEFAAAVEQARQAAQARPGPIGADELARVVSEQARAGSVQAMHLRWAQLRAEILNR